MIDDDFGDDEGLPDEIYVDDQASVETDPGDGDMESLEPLDYEKMTRRGGKTSRIEVVEVDADGNALSFIEHRVRPGGVLADPKHLTPEQVRDRFTGGLGTWYLDQDDFKVYNWPYLEELYVEGVLNPDVRQRNYMSIAEMSRTYDIQVSTLQLVAREEGWRDKRQAFQNHVVRVRQKRRIAAIARDSVGFDSKAFKAATRGLNLIHNRLGEIHIEMKHREQDGLHASEITPMNPAEMKALAQAADTWHDLGLKALGEIPTQRVELTGPDGGKLEVHHEMKPTEVMETYDGDRLDQLYRAAEAAGVAPRRAIESSVAEGTDDAGEAEDAG